MLGRIIQYNRDKNYHVYITNRAGYLTLYIGTRDRSYVIRFEIIVILLRLFAFKSEKMHD